MTDVVFYQDRPAQLGEAGRQRARELAVAQLVAAHGEEFLAAVRHHEEVLLCVALSER